jgi:hypothetical protein
LRACWSTKPVFEGDAWNIAVELKLACLVSFEQVGPAAQMALEAGETLGRVVLMMYLVEIGASAKSFYG